MVVAWSRNSCFVFLVLFENGEPSVSPRFHLVSDINQGNEFKIFLNDPRVGKILHLRELLKNRECALGVGSGVVLRSSVSAWNL